MGYPINSRYESRLSGATTIKAAWGDATDDAIVNAVGGFRSLVKLSVDGLGNVSGSIPSGAIQATGNIQSVSGHVVATKLVATTSPGLELRSGSSGSVFAQHYAARALVSGAVTVNLFSIPVTSGQAITAVARGTGQAQSGSVHHVMMFAASHDAHASGTFSPIVSLATDLLAIGSIPSGYLTGTGINSPVPTSGTVVVSVLGAASRVINWTVYTDVTYAVTPP